MSVVPMVKAIHCAFVTAIVLIQIDRFGFDMVNERVRLTCKDKSNFVGISQQNLIQQTHRPLRCPSYQCD